MRKRLLIATGLIVALLVPAVAFGANVNFTGTFPNDSNATIGFHVKRVNGKNKEVLDLSVGHFNVNCSQERKHGDPDPAADRHQCRESGRGSGTSTARPRDFKGEFRKGNKNKADGTLEVTLTGIDFGNGQGPENCHGGPKTFHAHT